MDKLYALREELQYIRATLRPVVSADLILRLDAMWYYTCAMLDERKENADGSDT